MIMTAFVIKKTSVETGKMRLMIHIHTLSNENDNCHKSNKEPYLYSE